MPVKPTDLTGGLTGLNYIGWNLPAECNDMIVGSLTGIFCPGPEMSYLYHTQEIIDKSSLEDSTNFLDTYTGLKDISIHSLSKESLHSGDMIVVKRVTSNLASVSRLTATSDTL